VTGEGEWGEQKNENTILPGRLPKLRELWTSAGRRRHKTEVVHRLVSTTSFVISPNTFFEVSAD